MNRKRNAKRIVAALVGVAMVLGTIGMAAADTVAVDPTFRVVEAYAEYGVDASTLAKASSELTAAERRALQAIYGDDDARGALNGIVIQELWKSIDDTETIATMTLAGRVYKTGAPEAFE